MNLVPKFIIKNNTNWKAELLKPYLKTSSTLLDFGCGDLSLAEGIQNKNKQLKITGIDVVKFSRRVKGIKFVSYNGTKIPFKDNTFDTVIAFYVYHHCDNAQKSFEECFRVAKKQVVFIEPVMRYPFENYLMGFVDWIFNIWKEKSISYAHEFISLTEWKKVLKNKGKFSVKPLRSFFPIPIGKAYVFKVIKR